MALFRTPPPAPRSPCTGVILAGGLATRYGGEPKGLLRIGGKRIIDRVAAALQSSCDSVVLIANDPAARSWLPELAVGADIYTGSAGLGGIHAALTHAGGNVIVVAWDMPFVPASLLTELRANGETADAVLPASGSKRGLEPLCAFYSQACLPAITTALEAGEKRPVAFHESVRLRVLSPAEVSRHGDPGVIFMNVNTPEDYMLAQQLASAPELGGAT